MLVIRPEQMEVFKEAALRSFEQEIIYHLFKFVPQHSEAIGKIRCWRPFAWASTEPGAMVSPTGV